MSKVITVIAVLTDAQKAVFIDNEGKRHTVQQTDPALAKLIRDVMPIILADQKEAQRTGKPQKGVKVDLSTYSMYAEFEQKTNGLVRFFRAAKEKLQSIVEWVAPPPDVEEEKVEEAVEMELETVVTEVQVEQPVAPAPVPTPEPVKPAPAPYVPPPKARYDDVKDHLKPVNADTDIAEDETLVAVVNGVVIPGIESLKPYISHALKHNSVKAVTAFLERIARVIDTKGHTIPDLMKFIEKGDLPLADDGCIIAYKILNRTDAHGKYSYVDCHSSRVHQRVGSYVRIPEKMVDPDRRRDCSNGLHVARRGYLGSFSGNVCVIIKMPPEDVVAVPEYNANKVRTCGYMIIGELSNHVFNVLRSGKGMASDEEATKLLQKAISGDHIGVLEEVWINGPKGTNLEVKNEVDKSSADKALKADAAKEVVKTEAATNIDPEKPVEVAKPIDPRDLNKQIKEEQSKQEVSGKTAIQIRYDEALAGKSAIAQELLNLKKSKKKSWTALGLPADAGDKLQGVLNPVAAAMNTGTPAGEALKPAAEPKKKAVPAKPVKVKKEKPLTKTQAKTKPAPKAVVSSKPLNAAQTLYLENKWADLWALKKAKKKGWATFGFSPAEIAEIEKHKP